MKSYLIMLALLFTVHAACPAQEHPVGVATTNNKGSEPHPSWFIGTNPIAVLAAFQWEDNVKRYMPVVAGLECGFSLTGGYFRSPKQMLETRFAAGNIHQIARVVQWHLGMNYFPLKKNHRWFNDFYLGGFFKFWDYTNRYTKIHFYNIAPYLTLGYLFDLKPIFVDVRLNQTVAVYSWSNLKHSSAGMDWFLSPWPKFLPVMPSLTFSLAWRF